MSRTSNVLIGLLVALLACTDGTGPDGGYINPGNLGDGSGDEDDVQPGISFNPATVLAGSFLDVRTTLTGFDLSGADVAYGPSSEEVVFHAIQGIPDGDEFTMRFHFGLLAWEGLHPWGMQNSTDLLFSDFDVVGIDPPALLEAGLPAAEVELDNDEQFAAWELAVPANHYVAVRVRPEVGALVPLLWLMDMDGVTVVDELTEEPMLVWYTDEEPFSGFLRVQDRSMANGFDFAIDLAKVDAGEPTVIPEQEPNGEPDQWQDVGTLQVGRYAVTGVATSAGHDEETDNPNGDLEVFTFELAEPSRVAFNLHWSGHGDFDAVLFVHADGETDLGFDSPQTVDRSMATLANPESTDLQLAANTRYTLLIANWQGDPDMDWTLDLAVYPGFFPGD